MERILITGLTALVWFGSVAVAKADEIVFQQGQERIVWDAQASEYVIEYVGDDGTLKTVRWTPATNVKVSVRSKFTQNNDHITYRYTIKNRKDSSQPVLAFRILVRNDAKKENISAPQKWNARLIENFDDPSLGLWASWAVKSDFSLSPGKNLTGFEIVAKGLPGVGMARVRGLMSVLTYPDEGPGGALIEFMEQGGFLRKASEGVLLPAAVPKIPVPDPFDAVAVLTSVQKHVKEDIVAMNLIDPAFAATLDRPLQAAIDAGKAGNTTGVKGNLKDFRRLLKREHEDVDKDEDWDKDDDWGKEEEKENKEKDKPKRPIDKLAARVLDFDAKYILKKLGHDD
jgi:hypothetical protein